MGYIFVVQYVVYNIFNLYLLVLIARALLSWVRVFNPYWRPQQPVVVFLLKTVYFLTEPPLALLNKFIKPLQFGNMGIDLSFIVLFLLVMVLQKMAISGLDLLASQLY